VPEHEGQLILGLKDGHKAERQDDDRSSRPVRRLEGIGPDPRVAIDQDREIAVLIRRFRPAQRLGHRLHILRDGQELVGGAAGGSGGRRGAGRRGSAPCGDAGRQVSGLTAKIAPNGSGEGTSRASLHCP
jgi:hypothetical protein